MPAEATTVDELKEAIQDYADKEHCSLWKAKDYYLRYWERNGEVYNWNWPCTKQVFDAALLQLR